MTRGPQVIAHVTLAPSQAPRSAPSLTFCRRRLQQLRHAREPLSTLGPGRRWCSRWPWASHWASTTVNQCCESPPESSPVTLLRARVPWCLWVGAVYGSDGRRVESLGDRDPAGDLGSAAQSADGVAIGAQRPGLLWARLRSNALSRMTSSRSSNGCLGSACRTSSWRQRSISPNPRYAREISRRALAPSPDGLPPAPWTWSPHSSLKAGSTAAADARRSQPRPVARSSLLRGRASAARPRRRLA